MASWIFDIARLARLNITLSDVVSKAMCLSFATILLEYVESAKQRAVVMCGLVLCCIRCPDSCLKGKADYWQVLDFVGMVCVYFGFKEQEK
ncbi:MAG: hypothetical protein RQ733_04275 [Methyloprofundus sp.]|nr:hypothetical protein [Methyloprofundus sp.]